MNHKPGFGQEAAEIQRSLLSHNSQWLVQTGLDGRNIPFGLLPLNQEPAKVNYSGPKLVKTRWANARNQIMVQAVLRLDQPCHIMAANDIAGLKDLRAIIIE